MKNLLTKSIMVLTMVLFLGLGITSTAKASTDGQCYPTSIQSTTTGAYTINGIGFSNAITTEVYDRNWNRVNTTVVTKTDIKMELTKTYIDIQNQGNGVVFFFDANHQQIGGSIINLNGALEIINITNKLNSYVIFGSHMWNAISIKVYDKNWVEVPNVITDRASNHISFNSTITTAQVGSGIILFFDGVGNQICGSTIALTAK